MADDVVYLRDDSVTKKSGVKSKIKPPPPPAYTELNYLNLEETINVFLIERYSMLSSHHVFVRRILTNMFLSPTPHPGGEYLSGEELCPSSRYASGHCKTLKPTYEKSETI